MLVKLGLGLLGGLLAITVGCSKSSDEPAKPFTADAERALGEPRYSFQQEQQDRKLESLSISELSEVASCSEKSSLARADRKKFSMSYGTLVRVVNNGQNMVVNQKFDYATENNEELYELTTHLLNYVIANQPVLNAGPIVYRDSCSASSGCDQEKRNFITGSSSYLINSKVREETIIEEARRETTTTDCSIATATETTNQLQNGQMRIGDTSYKAIQVTKKKSGKIYCRAGANKESLYLGEGVELSKTVYLRDLLVTPSKTNQLGVFRSSSLGCSRTMAFESRELQFEGTTIIGESSELVDYQFNGTIQTLDDWNKKQANIKSKIADLKNDIVVKKNTLDRAQLNVSESENNVKNTESKLADYRLQLNDAITGKKPNEDQLRILVKDAESALESAKARRDAAQTLLVTAQTQSKSADDALEAYVKENGNGEK